MSAMLRMTNVAGLFSAGIEADPAPTPAARRRARAAMLNERATQQIARVLADIAHACHPKRLRALPALLDFVMRDWLIGAADLPSPEMALASPEGLCGLARDLSPETLIAAYGEGLSPRSFAGFSTFWAPARRAVYKLDRHADHSVPARGLSVTFDQDFDGVLLACARDPARGAAPFAMSPALLRAFMAMHEAGVAHCFEVHDRSGKRVAGGFGVAIGQSFVTEGLFGQVDGAAEVGLAVLNAHLARWGYVQHCLNCDTQLIDSMTFNTISSAEFATEMQANPAGGKYGRWRVEAVQQYVHAMNHASLKSRIRKVA